MTSVTLHGEGGSDDEKAGVEGVLKVRTACLSYELANTFNVIETGLQYKILSKMTYVASHEKEDS